MFALTELREFTLGFFMLHFWKRVPSTVFLVSDNIIIIYCITQLRNLWLIFCSSLSAHSHPSVTESYWFYPLNIFPARSCSTSLGGRKEGILVFPIHYPDSQNCLLAGSSPTTPAKQIEHVHLLYRLQGGQDCLLKCIFWNGIPLLKPLEPTR